MATGSTNYEIKVSAEGTAQLETLINSLAKADKAAEDLARAETNRLKAANTNQRLTERLAKANEKLAQSAKSAAVAEQGLAKSITAGNAQMAKQAGGTSRFGTVAQNAGYQIQDFAVQVEMGTSAMRAFGQQAPQLLSGFGHWGTIIGTVIALSPLLIRFFTGATDSTKTFDQAASDLESTLSQMQGTITTLTTPFGELGFLADKNERAFRSFNEALLTLQRIDLQGELSDLNKSAQAATQGVLADAQQITQFADRLDKLRANTDAEFAARRITIAQRNFDKLVASLGVGEEDAIAFGRALTGAMNAFRDQPGTEATGQLLNDALKLAEKLNIELDKESRDLIERMAAANAELARTADNAAKLPPHLRDAADAAGDIGLALSDVKRIAESLSTIDLSFDLAGIEAETAALEAGASRIEAAAERMKASRLAELNQQLIGATAEQAAELVLQYQAWATAVDILTGAQTRQADVTDRLAESQRQQAEAAREAKQAQKDWARDATAAYRNLDSLLAQYMTPVEAIKAQKAAIDAAIAKVGEFGDITEDQLKLATRAWAELNEQLEESGKQLSEIGEIVGSSFNSFFSDLVDGTKSASEAFNDMLVSMINSITKFLFSRQLEAFLQAMTSVPGFEWMGTGGGTANLNAPLAAPSLLGAPMIPTLSSRGLGSSYGVVMPRQAIPPATGGSGSFGQPNVVINNYTSSEVSARQSQDSNGDPVLEIMIKEKVRDLVSSGALDRQMQTSYGIRRKTG